MGLQSLRIAFQDQTMQAIEAQVGGCTCLTDMLCFHVRASTSACMHACRMRSALAATQWFRNTCVRLALPHDRSLCMHRPPQIRSFLLGALEGAPLSLPSLEVLALHLDAADDDRHPAFIFGTPLASETGGEGVCGALADLVARRVLPALKQARLLQLSRVSAAHRAGFVHPRTVQHRSPMSRSACNNSGLPETQHCARSRGPLQYPCGYCGSRFCLGQYILAGGMSGCCASCGLPTSHHMLGDEDVVLQRQAAARPMRQAVLRPCKHEVIWSELASTTVDYNDTIMLSSGLATRAVVACHAKRLEPRGEHGMQLPEGVTCDALMARAYASLDSGLDCFR